jgi:hypothetical protein
LIDTEKITMLSSERMGAMLHRFGMWRGGLLGLLLIGKYRFRIAKDGYETLVLEQRVRAPWYELPGLDFFSENLIPWTIRDVRYYYPVMKRINPLDRPPEQLLQEAQQLQAYGKTIGAPLPPDLNPPAGASPTVLLPPTR